MEDGRRLQIGVCRAFGKPLGTVARVHIAQVMMSIRTKLQNKEPVTEALTGPSASSLATRRSMSPRIRMSFSLDEGVGFQSA
ncbi:hypothetical protein Celaphus_00001767 [Cervus elaphus hippelaphus]|uniref:Uncharacterized protein n=1 Tax=Cervus elaphus hippelaphus TaxID=46360 RepID=A0A212CGK9_CEREH|nr:hypothetical protein Celaphus_00001767 [Cervus elaphus hippelaphus]